MSDAVLRTTLIAGFPGESEEDQKETLAFLKEVQFDHLGVFPYSREEGTAAYNYPHQIAKATKLKRRDEIMALVAFFASLHDVKGHWVFRILTIFFVPLHYLGYFPIMNTYASGTVSCHCGPHTLGILYFNDGPHPVKKA